MAEEEERELSSETIILELGTIVAKRIERKAIYNLRHQNAIVTECTVPSLNTLWDEFCVQVQGARFPEWPWYEDLVWSEIRDQVKALPLYEQEALWLTTDEAEDWFDSSDIYNSQPVELSEIVQHLYDSMLEIAYEWTNRQIEYYHRFWDR